MMQYIYHLRYRPTDNNILYWRKFYAEYFSPHSKKRWCLSRYENVGHHNLGVFPQVAMDSWHCDICGSKRGRGFETTFEVLPRLAKIKFDSGVIDEFLFLEVGDEYILPSGMMMIEYGRAIQESVYEQLRVVREGQLRVTFTPDLKILKWEFCARRHEEFLHRRLVAPQVSQLMQVAQKYQNSLTDNGSSGASVQDLQTNCNMFMSIGRQLAKNLELQSLNDLGLSKRYVRCLQIAEVVNGMKDLIDFSQRNNMGPIESLKSYTRQTTAAKLQAQKLQMEQPGNTHGLPADQNTLNKVMGMHSGLSHNINHNQSGPGVLNNAPQTPMALSNNYQPLLRQNSTNSITNSACTFDGSNQGQVSSLPGSISNTTLNTLSNPYRQHRLNLLHQQSNPQTTQVNQQLQEQMLQQVLQEMMNTNRGAQQQTPSRSTPNGNEAEDAFGGVSNSSGGMPMRPSSSVPGNLGFGNNMSASTNNIMSMAPSRTNSFQANAGISNQLSSNTAGTNAIGSNPDMLQGPHMATELLPGISHEFCENGLFSTDSGDMSYGWKV
ncbi:Transcriptional corepressor SEUSS [Acorus calamus]|uniref:Transcriptional corepressor SEUSS n=1 Tax=Acorus calamus TaxID=4465 RepID=A0AAV9DAL1_ACOCL|nr:Transcriptional corepressor SEUSS [Acorus calamus]